ncbi:NRDE family protein [Bhargavaea cecembensis]|uniref:NRDE family protein n=1 Tax=Bhargavaea cecembensis TaxID=394098 RepID=UPI0005917C9E|nr:NRDE family protein [Bhargavaea cecembensis]
MCLVLFNHDEHPVYPLIVAANRDEFYDRPAQPAHWWEQKPGLLAGRDLQSGGTWLGMTKGGRFAALTNVRKPDVPPPPGARTRGGLVTSVLEDDQPLPKVLETISAQGGSYDMYNLIAGTPGHLFYGTNRDRKGFTEIPAGTHGLSNDRLDTPWPKVEYGKERLARIAEGFCPIDPDELFDILAKAEPFPDKHLPDTGVGPDMERMLSPLFIRTTGYGTRCSTVILADRDGRVTFIERTFKDGEPAGEESFTFQIH